MRELCVFERRERRLEPIGERRDRHRLRLAPLRRGPAADPRRRAASSTTAGLAGHSDADVLTHAVIDALLGAAGLGDIGAHFPDTDERWRDADSIELLRHVAGAASAPRACALVNVDATVVLERPKVGPHRDAIRERLAEALGLDAAPRQREGHDRRGHGLRRPRGGGGRAGGRQRGRVPRVTPVYALNLFDLADNDDYMAYSRRSVDAVGQARRLGRRARAARRRRRRRAATPSRARSWCSSSGRRREAFHALPRRPRARGPAPAARERHRALPVVALRESCEDLRPVLKRER